MGGLGTALLGAAFLTGLGCLALLPVPRLRRWSIWAGVASGGCVLAAAAVLMALLVLGDYSVSYVLAHTDRALPLIYKVSAFWSGAAGSLLLWAVCGAAACFFALGRARREGAAQRHRAVVTAVMTGLNLCFMGMLLFSNNPFAHAGPNTDGFGLNPALQSLGMVFHPPVIMVSYACVILALAGATANLRGEPRFAAVERAARLGWLLLTAGIVTGGVWAYRELGWGGYWSWDPIENSALCSWLLLTGYLHLRNRGKPQGRKAAFGLLTATGFSILFGTVIARSGVLESVHAYTGSMSRRWLLLVPAALALAGGLALLLLRRTRSGARAPFFPSLAASLPVWLPVLAGALLMAMTLTPLLPLPQLDPARDYDRWLSPLGAVSLAAMTVFYAYKPLTGRQRLLCGGLALLLGAAAGLLPAFRAYGIYPRLLLGLDAACLVSFLLRALLAGVGSGRAAAGFLMHLAVLLLALGLLGSRGMKTEAVFMVQAGDTVSAGGYRIELTDFQVREEPEIKTWSVSLRCTGGGKARETQAALQYYQKKGIYHAKAVLLRNVREDVCLLVENAADDGILRLKVVLTKWIPLLWAGLLLLAGAFVADSFLCPVRGGTAENREEREVNSGP